MWNPMTWHKRFETKNETQISFLSSSTKLKSVRNQQIPVLLRWLFLNVLIAMEREISVL